MSPQPLCACCQKPGMHFPAHHILHTCGFCFVMFYSREDTEDAVKYISGTIVDDRPIRVDFDWSFQEGRQWGRGRSGGQVRDEYRTDYDPGRGGYGKIVQKELEGWQLVDYGGPVGVGALQSYGGGFPHNSFGGGQGNYGGYQHGRGGRKRDRNDDHMLADGVKRVKHQNRLERNPRFRDKGDDSDEDEGGKA